MPAGVCDLRALAGWDLVVFDNDGVLVDSEVLANGILAEVLTGYGVPTTFEQAVARYLGGTVARVRSLLEADGHQLPDRFEREYEDAVLARFADELRPVPGVADVLDLLERHGVPVCVASSGTRTRIASSLARTGLADRFAGRIFSAEDVGRGKPAPDLFLHAAVTLGADPARCLVVEDSPLGVEAGLAAGMVVAGYCAVTPAERLARAGATFDAMGDLPRLAAGMAPDRGSA